METDHNATGFVPQANGLAHRKDLDSRQLPSRIPTVKEALPYSPFSSVVPFNTDLITPPLALPHTRATAFDTYDDVKRTRTELERLFAGAKKAEDASKRCQQTLADVQRLLDGDNLTQFKFKTSKRVKTSTSNSIHKRPSLNPFAKIVFEKTDVQYRYLIQDSDGQLAKSKTQSVTAKNRSLPQGQQLDQSLKSHPVNGVNGSASQPKYAKTQEHREVLPPSAQSSKMEDNSSISSNRQSTPTPFQTSPNRMTPSKAYVSLANPTPAQLAEYQKVPDTSYSAEDPTTLRNQNAYLTNAAGAASVDERRKGNLAAQDLNDLIQKVFEAHDQMQPDTSGVMPMDTNAFFSTCNKEGGSVPVLHQHVQIRLDNALQKVVACRRLDNVEVEHLLRVQGLCESVLATAESESLHIGEDWCEEDVRDWVARLDDAQSGLVAARTMMRIMTGGSHHKELQSEDFFHIVLNTIRSVVERCIIPIVEERSFLGEKIRGDKSLQRNPKFDIAMENRKALQTLVQSIKKCLKLLGDLLTATDVDESGISSVEYLCKTLIFAENASTDRESALGTAAFENLRVAAMDVLGRIFTKHTDQRHFIFDEILLSLEKLPAKKQNARQFLLKDGKPIQLVSALLIRLVQTSATSRASALRLKVGADEDEEYEEERGGSSGEESDESDTIRVHSKKRAGSAKSKSAANDLPSVYKPLLEDAQKHSSYIVRLLLQRALSSSKTSDEPFRRLLDLFTEDFLNVLGNADWPAAELLLRTLVIRLIAIAEAPKSSAPSRTLSLELLGTIGCGIVDVQNNAILAAKSLPQDGDDLIAAHLTDMSERIENGDLDTSVLTSFEGPYRVVLEYLSELDVKDDPQLQTARGYHLVQWAELLCGARESSVNEAGDPSPSTKGLQSKLRHMIEDVRWLEAYTDFPTPTTAQGRAAAKIVAANSLLCKAFARIFSVILHSMSSDQPTVRSRSIKSVTTLLEKDPSILDRNSQILNQIMRSLSDNSALVRESALGLVQKCVTLRPTLELKIYDRIIPRTRDANAPVRKRSMAFLKQVYLRNVDNDVRASISSALIARIKDTDEGVADVARTTIEEVWFTAFRASKSGNERDFESVLHLRSHAALVIQTVELGDNVAAVLEELIKSLLTQSKQATQNVQICRSLIQVFFDGIISTADIPGEPSQSSILRTLTVFARAAPKMFTAGQLEHLEPYAQNLQDSDDLNVYHYAITTLRYTMPVLTGIKQDFLRKLQKALLGTVGKLPKSELSVVAPCLWTIDTILGGTENLLRLVISALFNVYNLREQDPHAVSNKVSRFLRIVGQFGKVCNFDPQLPIFKTKFPWYTGKTVAGLMVEVSCKFTSPKNPAEIRQAALASVCEICSSFPDNFMRADVVNAIETVLKDRQSDLEEVLLTNLEEFFNLEVTSAEEQEILGTGIESGTQRLNDTYQATSYDTASNSLAQRFLTDFLRIALSSLSEVSTAAARIIVHINTRGIAHPGESGPGIAALETCPNPAIAKMAFLAHQEQFKKHEHVLEKGLVKAVQQAFEYQKSVAGDASGLFGNPPAAKLHYFWEVLKAGKPKLRSKFFANLCASMDFDLGKLKLLGDPPTHVLYTRFCAETVAMLEFSNVDEPLQLLGCLEKVTSGTGTTVAQAIESEVLQLQVPLPSSQLVDGDLNSIAVASAAGGLLHTPNFTNPKRLRQLAVAAQILMILWETRSYIRRLYNLQKYVGKPKKTKKDEKESDKKPTRASNAASLTEAYQATIVKIMSMGDTEEAERKMCTALVELSNVETDVKVGSEGEDEMDLEDGEDGHSEVSSAKSPGTTPRGKKRKSVDFGVGPPKKRSRPVSSTFKVDDDDDDGWL